MGPEWCKPCRDRGRLSIATHEVAGTLMCDECFREKPSKGVSTELAAQVLKTKKSEDTTMAKHTSEGTRAAILTDAAAGMNVEQIRLKHGVGWITAKKIIDENGGNGAKNGKKAERRTSSAKSPKGNGAMTAMEELCEALWAALPLEKKAELLKRMHEVN